MEGEDNNPFVEFRGQPRPPVPAYGRQYAQRVDQWRAKSPDVQNRVMPYIGGHFVGQKRHQMYNMPFSSDYYRPGNTGEYPDGVYYDGYGPMPQKVFQRVGGLTANETNPGKKTAMKQVWGGTLGPMPVKLTTEIKENLEDQYGDVIQAIENTLGSRTKSTVWQGRIQTQKAIWDM